MLYPHAKKPFEAKRYYSIDRVFRNVAVDRTHLAEFHQIEGLICDRGLSLGDLQGECPSCISSRLTIRTLSRAWKYSGLKKWVEVGNSGMFRPETLLPMCSSFQFMWQRVYVVVLASCWIRNCILTGYTSDVHRGSKFGLQLFSIVTRVTSFWVSWCNVHHLSWVLC
ncbi:putative phenylalanine--tRNA ligase [Helianthus annuus]|nr:putative phenylalanine--tRNA ligase [Helianthus annuus]